MRVTRVPIPEVLSVQSLEYQMRVVLLRDFLLGYLAAKGGEARIEELLEALRRLPRRGILVPASQRALRAEIEYLAALGLLEKRDGTVRLRSDALPASFERKLQKLAKLLALTA